MGIISNNLGKNGRIPYKLRAEPQNRVHNPRNLRPERLSTLLTLKSLTPLWFPTISTAPTPQTLTSLSNYLTCLLLFSAIAFPSRSSIHALSTAIVSLSPPLLPPQGNTFIIAALGKDAELIDKSFCLNFCDNLERIEVLVPTESTPSGLVKALGYGLGKNVLCPVPAVIGVQEPPVVPNFLKELKRHCWDPVRVNAYETKWLGATCAKGIIESDDVDAMIFTRSAEVEGLLKSLGELGWDWGKVKRRWPEMVVAAHGPVTAAGAERLGVEVDVVSERFGSFEGVVDAVDLKLRGR